MCGVITHALASIEASYMDVVTYPYPNHDASLYNLR